MKKSRLILGALIVSILAISFVAAQRELPTMSLGDVIGSPITWLTTFLFGTTSGAAYIALNQFLVFVLLACVLYVPANKLSGGKSWLAWIIAIVIGIIGVRFFITEGLIKTVLMPYSVLAIVLSIIVPLALLFYFLNSIESAMIRKLGWLVMAFVFFLFTILRWDDLADKNIEGVSGAALYLLGVGIPIIFLFMDRTMQRFWRGLETTKELKNDVAIQKAHIKREIADLEEQMQRAYTAGNNAEGDKLTIMIQKLEYALKKLDDIESRM